MGLSVESVCFCFFFFVVVVVVVLLVCLFSCEVRMCAMICGFLVKWHLKGFQQGYRDLTCSPDFFSHWRTTKFWQRLQSINKRSPRKERTHSDLHDLTLVHYYHNFPI